VAEIRRQELLEVSSIKLGGDYRGLDALTVAFFGLAS